MAWLATALFLIVALGAVAGAQSGHGPGVGTNLVANPNFASTDGNGGALGWRADPSVWARDTATALPPATASLRYNNSDPRKYLLATQTVVGMRLGRTYTVSARVKTVGLDSWSGGGGATVCVQWLDTAKKWLGGSFPMGPNATTAGWVVVTHDFKLPPNADPTTATVSVYVRPHDSGAPTPVGTAYFDNVSVVHTPPPALTSVLLRPLYRGRVAPPPAGAAAKPIAARAHLSFDFAAAATTVVLTAKLASKSRARGLERGVVARQEVGPFTFAAGAAATVDIVLDEFDALDGLALGGEYTLTVECIAVRPGGGTGNVTLGSRTHSITRVDDTKPPPRVYIDQDARAVVDGLPWFPMGVYFSTGLMSPGHPALLNVSKSPLNFVMPYGEATAGNLDEAHRVGLKVVYSLKDLFYGTAHCPRNITSPAEEEAAFKARVAQFKSHPALLAWYTNDELPASTYYNALLAHQLWAEEGDADHPTWQVLCEDGEFGQYMGTFDVVGSDPYPIGRPRGGAAGMHEEVNSTVALTDHARPVWEVVQAMNWKNYHTVCEGCRTPTLHETRSMAWQAIAAGANGLIFYSYHDVQRNPDVGFDEEWGHIGDVTREVLAWAPVLLAPGGQAPRPNTTQKVDAVGAAGTGRGHAGAGAPGVLAVAVAPGWLMTRTHWVGGGGGGGAHPRHLVLFAVSDGSGSGTVAFDLTNTASFGCKPGAGAGAGLTVVVAMAADPHAPAPAPAPVVDGCTFTAAIPALAAVGYNITFH